MRYRVRHLTFCYFYNFFPFYPTNNPQNQNFDKMKKAPRDINILQMCTINDNYIMYGSQNMEGCREESLSLWIIFCPLPPNNPKT